MNVSFQDMAESLKVKPTANAAQQEEEKHPFAEATFAIG
jgi:hypothetical protein